MSSLSVIVKECWELVNFVHCFVPKEREDLH
jgi:hypothetical protein